jgi:hypothetical protein
VIKQATECNYTSLREQTRNRVKTKSKSKYWCLREIPYKA